MSFFLGHEELEVVIDVVWNHLGVWQLQLGGGGFGRGDDDAAVAGGDRCFEVFESVVVEEGVVAFVAERVVVLQVGDLSSEDSVLHVSVR